MLNVIELVLIFEVIYHNKIFFISWLNDKPLNFAFFHLKKRWTEGKRFV